MAGTRWILAVLGAALLVLGGIAWAKPKEGGTTPPTAPAAANDCNLAAVQKAPWCKSCNKFVEKEEMDGAKHKACGNAPEMIAVCVKVYFTCTTCGKPSQTGGKCPTDKADMEKKTSRARLIWRCPLCRTTSPAPGKCSGATCKGKSLEQSCELSGMLPHIRTWTQP
jgi:hypothetical protein